MLFVSAKASRLLEFAIARLADAHMKQVWSAWSKNNLMIKGRFDSPRENVSSIPKDIAEIAVFALDKFASDIGGRRISLSPTDDESTIDNDLSFIASIRRTLKSEDLVFN